MGIPRSARLTVMTGLVLAAAAVLVSGCQKHGGARAGTSTATTLSSAEELYHAGRYAEAKARAEHDYRRCDGQARRHAALTAGMAAHALGKTAEARGWLEPLVNDDDPAVSGRACAALGVIALQQGDHARSATLLSSAASKLGGDDSARALLRAGHALSALGRSGEAATSYQAALAAAQTPTLQAAIRPYTQPGPFSLQVGVFSTKPNAEQRASEVRTQAARLGLGSPRIAQVRPEKGGQGYSVQVGSFTNRYAAVLASEKLVTPSVIVAAR